jgi:hypothetical protein
MKPPVWLLAVIISLSEKVAPAGSVPHSVRLTAGKPNVVTVKTARKGLRVRAPSRAGDGALTSVAVDYRVIGVK